MEKYHIDFVNSENVAMDKINSGMVIISGGYRSLEERNKAIYRANLYVDSA